MTASLKKTLTVARTTGRLAAKLAIVSMAAIAVVGCRSDDDDATRVMGYTQIVNPDEMHPIIVSKKPAKAAFAVSQGSNGLSPAQRSRFAEFINRYHSVDSGNSRLLIKAPAGGANEGASLIAVAQMRDLLSEIGFDETLVSVEAYHAESANAPIHVSYERYVAEAPPCGRFDGNLADQRDNLNYTNFGCSDAHNLAVQVSNPADLVGPRTETQRSGERRFEAYDKYLQGDTSSAKKTDDERAATKSQN